MAFKRWLYRGGHPNQLAKILNHGWAFIHALGVAPNYMVTLDVAGRQSGKTISFPLAMVTMDGKRYLVSMLGENANWVRNLEAADGKARLRHGKTEDVCLVPVAIDQRPPILKRYLQVAPGARPHIPVDKDAPIDEFTQIAPQYPVFRVERLA